ncbi:MAG: NAD(P)/FAD-dependent oxidoreductase [Thermoplasmata archaeon]
MYDVIIVGAGPAGLTAGIFARSRRLETLIIDAGKAGGQLTFLYPTKLIHDYPSYIKIGASDLARLMITHAKEQGCEIREEEEVISVERRGESIQVKTLKGEYEAKTVILALGMGLFEPRKLGVPGEEKYAGKGVYYRIPRAEEFKDKKVLFVGGGDTALEMALSVEPIAKEVILIHRKDVFRAMEENVENVEKSSIRVIFRTELKEIQGNERVNRVIVFNNETGEETIIELDAVVINIGFSPNLARATEWGIELDEKGKQIPVDASMRTSVEGIFACGDIVSYPGKDKRIVTGCGEGATAAISAYKYIKKPYWA